MTEQSQPSPKLKHKSLLQTHQDAPALAKTLNEFASSQQTPVSRHMMYSQTCSSSSRAPTRFLLPKSTSSDPLSVNKESQGDLPNHSAATVPKPVSGSGIPVLRRRPRQSEQPTVAMLAEMGVKVRDFAYESTLPPVPTVYLQPRQIQPSVPKDVNDPNDPHYVLEEERKKKAYTFQSTRKIERTPTEPVLESDLQPPPRRSFPKIKRADAMLDLGSQSQPQPQSQPSPTHSMLPYDITNTSFSSSQPLHRQPADPPRVETWVHTPIVTPNHSPQRPSEETMDEDTDLPPPQLESTRTDSQSTHSTRTMSYFQMGLADSNLRPQSSGTRTPHLSRSSNVVGRVPVMAPGSTSAGRACAGPKRLTPSVLQTSVVPTSTDSRKWPSISEPPPSASVQQTPSSPVSPATPRYNLRSTKRRAESSHPPSSARSSRRPRLQRAPIEKNNPLPLSAISTHKASANVISTGRTTRRTRATNGREEGLRQSKQRSQRV